MPKAWRPETPELREPPSPTAIPRQVTLWCPVSPAREVAFCSSWPEAARLWHGHRWERINKTWPMPRFRNTHVLPEVPKSTLSMAQSSGLVLWASPRDLPSFRRCRSQCLCFSPLGALPCVVLAKIVGPATNAMSHKYPFHK